MPLALPFTGGQLRLHEADFKLWPWLQRCLIVVSPTQQGRHTKKHLEDTLANESQYLNNFAVNTTAGPSHAGPARGHTHGSHHIETGCTGRTCVPLQCCMVRRATGSLHLARQAVYQPLNFNHSNLDASVALSTSLDYNHFGRQPLELWDSAGEFLPPGPGGY